MATEEVQTVSQANLKFSNELFSVLSESKQNENIFFSPISAHAALAMAALGAAGDTLNAFVKTLHIPDNKTVIEGYKDIIAAFNEVTGVKLHMANKLFIQESYELEKEFLERVKKGFLSETALVNFAKSAEAAKTINTWVEDKTANKIKDLLQESDLNALTRLVLVNAIYFKGDWKNKFNPAHTKSKPFYLNDTDTVEVDMMHLNTKNFFYTENRNLDAKLIELPYVNNDLSLVVILPNSKTGIGALEEKLKSEDLTQLMSTMRSEKVNLQLPKFKIESTIDLEDLLTKLGLGIIFNQNEADFSGINSAKELYVSKVIQKAFIEVNEEGAEAAAATAAVMMMRCALPRPERIFEFFADRPFLINLVHRQEQNVNVLFGGRIYHPKYE